MSKGWQIQKPKAHTMLRGAANTKAGNKVCACSRNKKILKEEAGPGARMRRALPGAAAARQRGSTGAGGEGRGMRRGGAGAAVQCGEGGGGSGGEGWDVASCQDCTADREEFKDTAWGLVSYCGRAAAPATQWQRTSTGTPGAQCSGSGVGAHSRARRERERRRRSQPGRESPGLVFEKTRVQGKSVTRRTLPANAKKKQMKKRGKWPEKRLGKTSSMGGGKERRGGAGLE